MVQSQKRQNPGAPETEIIDGPPEIIDGPPENNRWSRGHTPKKFEGPKWGVPSSVRHETSGKRRRQRDGSIGATARIRNGRKTSKMQEKMIQLKNFGTIYLEAPLLGTLY